MRRGRAIAVSHSDMFCHLVLATELSSTLLADERIFVVVDALVPFFGAGSNERHSALLAAVRSLARVGSHVALKMADLTE